MNKSSVDEVIETFDDKVWQEKIPSILEKEGIKVFEKWLGRNENNQEIIDRFVDVFIECYELFSPYQPRNIYVLCSPDKIWDIINRVHQSGDHVKYEWLIKSYIFYRTRYM